MRAMRAACAGLLLVVAPCMKPAPLRMAQPSAELPDGAIPYHDSSGSYERWWNDVQRCVGKRAAYPFSFINFYIVLTSGHRGLGVDGPYVIAGYAYPAYSSIVMASPWVLDSGIVRHEMLHLVANSSSHPARYFQRQCAWAVTCVGSCLRDTI